MAKDVTIYSTAGRTVAQIVGNESTALDEVAAGILSRARALAATHIKSGDYYASLGVDTVRGKGGVTDRQVYSDDKGAGWIEWGHVELTDEGPKRVAGQYILTRAAQGGA
jgi:hypothetical protein